MAGEQQGPTGPGSVEQVGAHNVVIEQGEYRRWVRDQIGRSISGQLTVLVSVLGSGGFLALATGALVYVNVQRDMMMEDIKAELSEQLLAEVEREVDVEVARSIISATGFAEDLANAVSTDRWLRQQFFEELFTPATVGGLTAVAAGQRTVDTTAPLAIRGFALSQTAIFGPDLLPGVAAELLLSADTPRELTDQALDYYEPYEDAAAPADIDLDTAAQAASTQRSPGGADEGLFLTLPHVQQAFRRRDAGWMGVHDEVVDRVLGRLLDVDGGESCESRPAYCRFFANLSSDEADVAFARYGRYLRGETSEDERWDNALTALLAVDGARGFFQRAPDLYADAQTGDQLAAFNTALQQAISRFGFAAPGFADEADLADARALEALDAELRLGPARPIGETEALVGLLAKRMAEALAADAEPPSPSPLSRFAPRAVPELERAVAGLERAAADDTAARDVRVAALQTLKLMLGVAAEPEASAGYRLALDMVGRHDLGVAQSGAGAELLDDVRARLREAFAWRRSSGGHTSEALALADADGEAAAGRWLAVDLNAPGLDGDLPLIIDVASPLIGYVVVDGDGAVVDGALAPPAGQGRTQILIDRDNAKSDRVFLRLTPPAGADTVLVSAPRSPARAPTRPDRAAGGDGERIDLEAIYQLPSDAITTDATWLRFVAERDGFVRLAALAAAKDEDRSVSLAAYRAGQNEAIWRQDLDRTLSAPLGVWGVEAGAAYDVEIRGRNITSPLALRIVPAEAVTLAPGETRRLSFAEVNPAELQLPRLPDGVYRIRTLQLGSGVDTILEVFNPAGDLIERDDDGGEESLASAVTFAAQAGQSFVANVSSYGESDRGAFSVRLDRLGERVVTELSVSDNRRLTFGPSGFVEVNIPQLPTGEYRLRTFDLDDTVDTVIELFSTTGASLAYDDDGGDEVRASAVRFTVRSAQGYSAAIRPYGQNARGEFSVELERTGDWRAPAADLVVGESRRLSFDAGNVVEMNVSALPSGEYRIRTFELDDGVDTVLELFDAQGASIARNDDGGEEGLASAITFRSDGSESFLASVRAYGGETAGGFRVQLDRLGD